MKKILVIKLSALGDFFASCGTFEKIRAHHPDAAITLLTTQPFKDVAAKAPYFDDIWVIAKPGMSDVAAWGRILKRFVTSRFDAVYDLQRNDRTKIIRTLSRLFGRVVWLGGPKGDKLSTLHTFTVPDGMLDTRDMAGFPTRDLSWLKGKTAQDFALGNRYVLIVPGCSARHLGKRWPSDSYARLAQTLLEAGYKVALIGTKEDEDVTAHIKNKVPDVVDLTCKTSLGDLATLAASACATIGNDTGPIHVAAAAGSPVVVLFSFLSDPAQSAPRYEAVRVLRAENIGDIQVDAVMSVLMDVCRPPV